MHGTPYLLVVLAVAEPLTFGGTTYEWSSHFLEARWPHMVDCLTPHLTCSPLHQPREPRGLTPRLPPPGSLQPRKLAAAALDLATTMPSEQSASVLRGWTSAVVPSDLGTTDMAITERVVGLGAARLLHRISEEAGDSMLSMAAGRRPHLRRFRLTLLDPAIGSSVVRNSEADLRGVSGMIVLSGRANITWDCPVKVEARLLPLPRRMLRHEPLERAVEPGVLVLFPGDSPWHARPQQGSDDSVAILTCVAVLPQHQTRTTL